MKVESVTLPLRPRAMRSAAESARRNGRSHNAGRAVFVRAMLQHLIDLYANATGHSPDTVDRDDVEAVLRESPDVRRELNLAWPPLAAELVLKDLFSSPERVFDATPGWSNDDRELLLRQRDEGWTTADVALLDEVAELTGVDDEDVVAESHRERRVAVDDLRHAREVLESMGGPASQLVSAESLASRFAESGEVYTVAERAFVDRTWTYGHVIVDEAQELSPMMWRLLMRRCPTKSFTVVGDMAQATGAAVSSSWHDALEPHVGDAWTRRDLTINYRTPASVMDQATAMLSKAGFETEAPTSVREGEQPRAVRIDDLSSVAMVVAGEVETLGDGRLAVIATRAHVAQLGEALAPWLSAEEDDLQAQVVLLSGERAKGLEFDVVVVVEPAAMVAESRHGHRALFVALTRPTQRLVLAHSGELPPGLAPAP
jgi:DNA helicase IV